MLINLLIRLWESLDGTLSSGTINSCATATCAPNCHIHVPCGDNLDILLTMMLDSNPVSTASQSKMWLLYLILVARVHRADISSPVLLLGRQSYLSSMSHVRPSTSKTYHFYLKGGRYSFQSTRALPVHLLLHVPRYISTATQQQQHRRQRQ